MLINKHTHPHLIKAYKKVLNTVESCQTKDQLENAGRMIKNFKALYKNVGYPKALSYNLDRIIHKQYKICQ